MPDEFTIVLMLFPAYGRRYETTAAAMMDFHDGKDFQTMQGPYASIRDLERIKADGHDEIHVYTDRSMQQRTVIVL